MFGMSDSFTSLPWNSYYGWAGVIWYVVLAIGLYSIFTKAGEDGWKAIIPVYNLYICFKISRCPQYFWVWGICTLVSMLCGWIGSFWIFFLFNILGWIAGVAAAVLLATMWYQMSVAFGHGMPFALGLIFLNPIFILILGYGGDRYRYGFSRWN